MKYRKKPLREKAPQTTRAPVANPQLYSSTSLLGLLYVVDVRLVVTDTREKIKHKLLVVGSELEDIERKLRWMFDQSKYKEMSISKCEKVREKVHFINTVLLPPDAPANPVIERPDGSVVVQQGNTQIERYDPRLFAVGIDTTMLAKDEDHALRKVGHAIIARVTEGDSHTGAHLSDESTIVIEEIPKSSGYAKARDVSQEVNPATFVRG